MVRKYSSDSDDSEARRVRLVASSGIYKVFTFWPGRYGQDVVEGIEGLHISVAPFNSYCVDGRAVMLALGPGNKEAMARREKLRSGPSWERGLRR